MPKRVLEGEVVSNKTDKTVTVLVERRYRHPVYKKYVKRTDKYAAHDEGNACEVGQRVQIIECRPISKTKRWSVVTGGESTKTKAPVKKTESVAVEKKETPQSESKNKAPAKKSAAAKSKDAKKKDA